MVNKNYIGKKTPQNKRMSYKYYESVKVDGEWKTKVLYEIKPDGTEETEILIKQLHSMDDAEIYNNTKNKRKLLNKEEKAEKDKWEEEHPTESWDYGYTQSLDALEEKGIQLDKTSILAVSDNEIVDEKIEKLMNAIQKLTPKQRELIKQLFWEGKTQEELAQEKGISQPAISKQIANIKKKIKKYF